MGVQIQPVSIWYNGQSKSASELDARIIYDDLATSANFYYQLLASSTNEEGNVSSEMLADGNCGMSGEDYQNWDDSNDGAYNYVAGKLNLTIVG